MEPTARSRTVPLFPAVCLALVAAFVLAAGGRAATGDTLPSPLAYADALGNIALSTDPAFSPINLTDDWKGDTNPALSPDGQQVVFARSFVGGGVEQRRELFRMNTDGGGLQRLTDNALFESWPTWSPDGARLAFAAGDLYVMPSAGGAAVQLTTGGLNPQNLAWSPDGARLAFNSWPCPEPAECGAAELYVVTFPGGQLSRLTNNAVYDGDPAWSPDGARLVYETGPADSTDVNLIPAAGGAPTPLVTTAANTDPAWSPDGAFIAYVRGKESDYAFFSFYLMIIRPDGSDARQLTQPDEAIIDPTWPADSQSVYFLHQLTPCGMACGAPIHYLRRTGLSPDDDSELLASLPIAVDPSTYTLSIAANRLLLADHGVIFTLDTASWPDQPQPLTGLVLVNGDPTWSPDGRRLAFSSQRDFNYNIHVMDADGTNRAAVTTHPGNDWNPTWSALNRIAFTSNRDGNWELYVMNTDGSGQTNLTHTPTIAEADAAWSPDGRRLAFARQEAGNWDIYVMAVGDSPDGGGLTRLTSHAASDRNPTWSPDGEHIAFHTDRDGNSELYVLTVDSPPGNETNLTHSPGDEREPAWSPDGTKIACALAHPDGDNVLLMMDANGSNLRGLLDTGPSPQPAWRPFARTPRLWLPAIRG